MAASDDDWRLTGQEEYLLGAEFIRKPYRARSETWEHEHCEFCWAKFMDPEFSVEHQQFIEDNPEILTEGYATTATESIGPTTTGSVLPASTTSSSGSSGESSNLGS
jgi:hypothetical protein